MDEEVKPYVVEAVGVLVGSRMSGDTTLAERIGEAMSAACAKCQAAGIDDPDLIRGQMLKARDRILNG